MLVCVGIPCLDGKPTIGTVDSLLAETVLGFPLGVHFLPLWEVGCSLIGPARNKIVRRFLATKADCLVFVDSDISWKGGALAALAKRPEAIIGGTYRAKTEEVTFHVRGKIDLHPGPIKVDGIPGGFMKVSRSVFGQIGTAFRDHDGNALIDWFPTGIHAGEYWGEDYGFCRLWREAGGDVWLDPDIELRHHDGTRVFAGNPRKWLEDLVGKGMA